MKKYHLKIIILFLIMILYLTARNSDLGSYLTLDFIKSNQVNFQNYYDNNKFQTLIYFSLTYIFTTSLSLPGATILSLIAGAIFGFKVAVILVSFASTIGATFAFLSARFLFKDYIQDRFKEKLVKFNDGMRKDGAYYLLTLRLLPIFPFFLINLLMGVTEISILRFFVVSQFGMFLGTVVNINAGKELAKINSLSDLFSLQLLLSFALIAILPLFLKKIINRVKGL